MLIPAETPIIILADGCFGAHQSKTGLGVIRYGDWPITAVIDASQAGKQIQEIVPSLPQNAPVVSTISEALSMSPAPKAMLIGTAPIGGEMSPGFRQHIIHALQAGLHVINGLHQFLNEDAELSELAKQHGVTLWDVRDPGDTHAITRQTDRPEGTQVITMVGSDCSVGKMSVALELNKACQQQGHHSAFVATGQTGIMITGAGIPLDRIISDFAAGSLEVEIDRVIRDESPDYVWVEGQGSLLHPAYSGVTMALLHGSAPDAMVLCHNPSLGHINQYPKVPIPTLTELIQLYETAAGWIKPAKIIGIALNTSKFSEPEALALIQAAEAETGLPASDLVRFDGSSYIKGLLEIIHA